MSSSRGRGKRRNAAGPSDAIRAPTEPTRSKPPAHGAIRKVRRPAHQRRMEGARDIHRPRTGGTRQPPCDGVAASHCAFVWERRRTPRPRTRGLTSAPTPLLQHQPLLYRRRGRGYAAATPRMEPPSPPVPCLTIRMNGTVLGRFSAAPGRAPLPVHGRGIAGCSGHDGLRWRGSVTVSAHGTPPSVTEPVVTCVYQLRSAPRERRS